MSAAAAPPADVAPWSGRQWWALVAITVLAIGVRMWGIERWSWNDDEAVTWRALSLPLGGVDGFLATEQSRAPLIHLLLRALVDLGLLPSLGEGWLRLPFAFVGAATVPLVAVVGRRWVGPIAAAFAAFLLALHPSHVAASQSASPEIVVPPLLLLIATAAEANRRWQAIGGVLVAGLCSPLGWCGALSLLPRRWLATPHAATVATVAAFVLLAALPLALHWQLTVLGAVAWVLRSVPPTLTALALAPVAALPFCWPAGALDHVAVAALPGLVLVAAAGGREVTLRWRRSEAGPAWRQIAFGGVVMTVIGLGFAIDTYLRATVFEGGRPRWREAARTAARAIEPGTGVVVGAGAGLPVLQCYLRPRHWQQPDGDAHPLVQLRSLYDAESAPAEVLRELLAAGERRGARSVLVLRLDERDYLLADATASALLQQRFEVRRVLPGPRAIGDATVYVLTER